MGLLIPNAKLDALAAGSITSADLLRNSRWSANYFGGRGTVIFRPGSATAADNIRYAGALTNTTGLLAHTGANYSDTTVGTEVAELYYNQVRPDLEILDAINRALERVFFTTFIGISHGGNLDFDMTDSTDTNWTDVGSPSTSAKSTTARRTPYGMRSYNLINNGVANEGTRSAVLGAVAGRQVSMFAISSVNVGTASLVPYDVTNSAVFGTAATVTHSEEEPQLMVQRNLTVPTSCTEMAARLLGTTTTSDVFWNHLWIYKHDNLILDLPTEIDEQFQAPSIFQLRPLYSNQTNIYDAQGVDMIQLDPKVDYRYIENRNDANPRAIRVMNPSYYQWPLMVQVRRPYSALITMSAEADSTEAPVHQLMPAVKMEILQRVLLTRDPANVVYRKQLAEAEAEWRASNAVRQVKHSAERPRFAGVPRL